MKRNGSMRLGMRRRALGVLSASTLAVGGMIALAGTASAAPQTIKCGQTLSGNVLAKNSIGPCSGGDAIKITASGTILDLAGKSITCNNGNNHTRREQVGVHLIGVSNVTVKNGEVSNCDAGVAIAGGGNNTVSGMRAHDNIAHVLVSGPVNPDNPIGTPCNLGDGITADNSNGNTITGNVVTHNGPYSGISLVDASSNNKVIGNQANNQTVSNELPFGLHNPPDPDTPNTPGDTNGPCGPFSANGPGEGRLHQDIGIRVEGPGAQNNTVSGNQVIGNQLNGISIHGFVCLAGVPVDQQAGLPPIGKPNNGNLVQGNSVSGNGFPDGESGISILDQGPLGTITCASTNNIIRGNSSTGNAGSGIFVSRTGDNSITSSNTVSNNVVDNNNNDGITLEGPTTVCPFGAGDSGAPDFICNVPPEPRNGANNNTLASNTGHNNGERDGFDGNPGCDNNHWIANIFGTVNRACVKANGGTGTVIPVP